MKKLLMGVCTFSLLMATGCSNEELVEKVDKQQYTLEVGVGMNSRTYNDEYGKCNWGDNEQIYVFSEDGTVSSVLTLIRKNGKTATFAGTVSGDPKRLKYTVYPVPNKNGEIEIKTIDGNNHNAPMYGTIEGSGAKLNFAGGVVKLDINGAGDGVFRAEGKKSDDNTQVTGGYYKFNKDTKKLEFVSDGNSTVTIKNIPSDGVVFLPVATSADLTAGQKDNVSLTLTTPEDGTITETVQVAQGASTQSDGNAFPSVNYDSKEGFVKTEIEDLDGLKKALEIGGEYELVADINASSILKIAKNITIKGNDKKITSTAKYVFEITTKKINVTMNKLNMVNNAEKATDKNGYLAGIKIDPNLEGVGLALDTCSVSFDNGDNGTDWAYAVNVAGGTSNCGITIKGGSYEGANVINVWGTGHGIYIKDATLTSLYKPNVMYYGVCVKFEGNGNRKETYRNKYYGEHAVDFEWPGGDIYMTGGGDENHTKCYVAKVDDKFYYTLEEAVATGEETILYNDVVLSEDITLKANLIIPEDVNVDFDLNGKKIIIDGGSAKDVIDFKNSGELTIENGAISALNYLNSRRCIYNYGTMTIDGVEFNQTYHDQGAAINNEGVMTIGYASVNAKAYAIWNSGNGGVVTVNDGLFRNEAHLLPQGGANYCVRNTNGATMTVNGGNFVGTHGAFSCDGGASAMLNAGKYECLGIKNVSDHVLYTPNDKSSITYNEDSCQFVFADCENVDSKFYGNCYSVDNAE